MARAVSLQTQWKWGSHSSAAGDGDRGGALASLLLPFSLHPPFFHPSLLTAQLKPILALLAALQRAPLARCPRSVSSGPPTPPASGPGPDPPRSMSTWQAEETNTNFPSSLIPGRLPCLPQLGWPHHPLGEPAQVSPVASTVTSLGLCSCSSDQCLLDLPRTISQVCKTSQTNSPLS